ncbi:hypothetical protein OKA05_11330 [Luteolibacter arcticus]|uniref:Ice-binding protein C-terminal domain-containing protein n=1 Tax=Luteolibacter arcticus TaxID=1581411 RepID=A0ABT3GI20_9BACT|nr:PEP-CTERM sorting domain-containing protein [Luteolibacter arcticus]MCW1923146.1 hypothetical protein [Luteolibacter arcticus]
MKSIPLLFLAACASVHGAVIIGVSATASTYFAAQQDPINLVNNAGLVGAGPYDFSSQHNEDVGSTGQWHAGAGQGVGGVAPVTNDQFVTFDLDGVGTTAYDLTSIYIWQHNQPFDSFNRGVNQFDLLYSIDGGTNWLTASSNLNLLKSTGGPNSAQQFTLSQTGVTHVRIEIDTAWSGAANEYVGLSEVKFDGVAVPEPASALLGAFGLLALLRRRR